MPDPPAEESNIPPDDVPPGMMMATGSVVLCGLAAALSVTAFALFLRLLVLDQRRFSEPDLIGEHSGVLAVAAPATLVTVGMFVLVLIARWQRREAMRLAAIGAAVIGVILQVWASVAVLVSFSRMGDSVPPSLGGLVVAYVLAEVTQMIVLGLLTE